MKKSHFLTNRAITSNDKYERNSTAFIASDGTIWVFYARADTLTHRTGSDVDNESYMIYCIKSRNNGTSWSSPTLLNKTRPSDFNQRDLSAMQDSSGNIWVFASSGDNGTYRPLIKYMSSNGGSTWSDADSITIPGQPTDGNNPLDGTRLGHSHVIYGGGKFHLIFQSSGGSAIKYSNSTDTSTWSSAVTIYASSHYVPKIMCDTNGTLYVVTAKGASGEIWMAKSTDAGASWATSKIAGSEAAWNDWDSFISRLPNNNLGVVWAPNVGSDGQQLKAITSSDNWSTWTDSVDLTNGMSGTEEWWDYWPQILIKETRAMIFYTSERKSDAPEFNGGNIWFFPPLPVDVFREAPIFSSGGSISGNTVYDRFLS